MKKLLLLLLFSFQLVQAQDSIPKSPLFSKKNEIRVDVLSTVMSKFNVTYERFFDQKLFCWCKLYFFE